jgi:hypothetical protein
MFTPPPRGWSGVGAIRNYRLSDCSNRNGTRRPDGNPVTIRIQQQKTTTKIQFVLPDDAYDGPVSAVGSFNDWQPGAHKLVRRSNGTRSVSVDVPRGQEVRFRYLGAGGVWFDDPDAHEITQEGSLVRA